MIINIEEMIGPCSSAEERSVVQRYIYGILKVYREREERVIRIDRAVSGCDMDENTKIVGFACYF